MPYAKRAPKNRRPLTSAHNDFYETMPLSIGSHPVYRDDVVHDYTGADDRPETSSYDETIRRVALATLVVSALVALAAGYLFVQGLSTIRDVMPAGTQRAGSLEL